LIGGGLLIWSLLSSVLLRLSVVLCNRFRSEEHHTAVPSWLRSLLGGGVAVATGLPVIAAVVYGLVVIQLMLFLSRVISPEQMASPVVTFLIGSAQMFALLAVKLLVSMAFVPCRVRPAGGIGFVWQLLEILLTLLVLVVSPFEPIDIYVHDTTLFTLSFG
ncbi:MAG: hypothetical protein ACK5Q5_03500, partial [Planctomycetaceae bacterium]